LGSGPVRDDISPDPLQRARGGDREAFGRLYDHYLPRVYAFCRRHVERREDAEDLTAQTFEKALAAIDRYEDRGSSFSSWLIRIAANTVVDRARRGSEVRLTEEEIERLGDEGFLRAWEEAYWLRGHIVALPDDQREVIRQRFFEDKAFKDVAVEMGRSEGAVKQLLRRALAGLAHRMRREMDNHE